MEYPHLIAAVEAQPWAITDEKWQVIQGLLEQRLRGDRLSQEDVRAALGADGAERRERVMVGPVAVVPLYGVMAQRMNLMTEMSGGTSTALFARDVRGALDDPNVQAIVLDVDSPGGSIYGVEEAASVIRAGRAQKPIVAVANSLAGSAAYWVASAAHQVVGAPGAEVGSIGVFQIHRDVTKAAEEAGIKFTLIRAGRYKAEGTPYEPLTDERLARLQARVDEALDSFVASVAAGRGVPERVVRAEYGEGQVYGTKRARAAGMIDRVATLDDTVSRLSTPQGRQAVMAEAPIGSRETTAQEPVTATAQESRRLRTVAEERLRFSLTTL